MPRGVYIRTTELRKKISLSLKGRKCKPRSDEFRLKQSLSHKGKKLSDETKKKIGNYFRGRRLSEEHKRKVSESRIGIIFTEEHKKNISLGRRGIKLNAEQRRARFERAKRGKHHWNWRGGIYPIHQKLRKSLEYKIWRKSVLERDNHTCHKCGSKENLEVDHIKPFSTFPSLIFDVDNGRTLCNSCHKKTETYGPKMFKKIKEILK